MVSDIFCNFVSGNKGIRKARKQTHSPLVYGAKRKREATNDWSPTIIYSFLYKLREPDNINEAIDWLNIAWEKSHHLNESYELAFNEELNAAHDRFKALLHDIKGKLEERYKSEKREEELFTKMVGGYCPEVPTVDPKEAVAKEETQTSAPRFTPPTRHASQMEETTVRVMLEDLPEDIRSRVKVSQRVFDVFVRQLNEDLWLMVAANKTKLCGCLFFLSNFYCVTDRKTNAKEFAKLLQNVVVALKGKGSVESSIRRRDEVKESTIPQSYKYYACADVDKKMEQKIFKLRNDCKQLLDGFQPVLDAMEAEKKQAQSQAVQPSAVA